MGAKMVEQDDRQCPRCGCNRLWRHSKRNARKMVWRCAYCKKTFVSEPYGISDTVRVIVDRLLDTDLPVPRIAMVMQGIVSKRWIYNRRQERGRNSEN